jgi:hypothetical protein
MSPAEVHEHMESGGEPILVCAYDSEEKFQANHLEGALSFDEFKSQLASIPHDREIIFYCA